MGPSAGGRPPLPSPSLLDSTRVILVHPFFPENLGAAARAMKNMGLESLVIADPGPAEPGHPHALQMAVHAEEILDRALTVATLPEALAGVTLSLGTSARQDPRALDPREAAELAARHAAAGGRIALVFGNEKNGLTRRELQHCHQQIRIPTASEQASLNLAQAVMVLAYQWRMTALPPTGGTPLTALATDPLVRPLLRDLEDLFEPIGFLKPHTRAARQAMLARILSRCILDDAEAHQLQSLAQRLSAHLHRGEQSET